MNVLAVIDAKIVDGNGGPVRENGTILIEGERITAIADSTLPVPASAEKIDGSGKYVIPGLIDANVHLVYGFSTEYLIRFEHQFEDIIREGAQIALRSGVTTVLDTWGPLNALKTVRDEIACGKTEGSRIFCAGNIVGLSGPFSSDFYASSQSVSPQTVKRINSKYEFGTGHELVFLAPEQVRSTMRAYLSNGMDFVKYAVSGHGANDMGFLLFSPTVQKVIVEETRRKGLTVHTHTTSVESLSVAVDAGVDLMQHMDVTMGEVIPDELIERIADRKIAGTLMIDPLRYQRHALGELYDLPPAAIADPQRRLHAIRRENRRKLIAANAPIVMATDGGVPHLDCPVIQDAFFRESYPDIVEDIVGFLGSGHLAWFRGAFEAGMSPMAALQAATRNAALAGGLIDDFGTIEVGKVADLVMLDTNPLADAASYGRIRHVLKAGRVIDHHALPAKRVLSVAS